MDHSLDNFQEWERVLATLEKIKRRGDLHHFQNDLIRLLKYRGNWRLCEAALKAIQHIQQPTAPLVSEVLTIIMDDNLYYEVRAMACHTLNGLIHRYKSSSNGCQTLARLPIAKHLKALTSVPQPPILSTAASACLASMAESIKT